MTKIKTGCFFGSFNPIHHGHLMVAEYMASQTDLDLVELVVSPHNPLKDERGLADEMHRLGMARIAVQNNPGLSVNDIEFHLDKPSYTIRTLDRLTEKHPDREFILIMGSDSLTHFRKWLEWERILDDYGCYVYSRRGELASEWKEDPRIRLFDSPQIDVSATYVRDSIASGHSIRYLVPDSVRDYIEQHEVFA